MQTFIKAVLSGEDWVLEVLGVPYGSPSERDSDSQYFDNQTANHIDKYPTVPAVYYHGRKPDGAEGNPVYFGKANYLRTDRQGIWYQVILDKTKELAARVWQAAKDGYARASSGSAPHLVRIGKDGHIDEWPVIELSVFDTGEDRQPANKHAIAIPMMKAIYKDAGLPLPDIESESQEALKAKARTKELKAQSKKLLNYFQEN